MKFVIAQNDKSPSFREGDEWHTESFDGEYYGLFLDDHCICVISSSQASFLNILKNDEDKISSIEITDGPITIQPKDAESFEYTRPTGEIDFKEKRMTRVELNKRKVEEAIKTLKKVGYKVDEMALERPSDRKARLSDEDAKIAKDRDYIDDIRCNVLFGDAPGKGFATIFNNPYWHKLLKEAHLNNGYLIHHYELNYGNIAESYSSSGLADNHDIRNAIKNAKSPEDLQRFYKYAPRIYVRFKEGFEDKITDDIADYLNECERALRECGCVKEVALDSKRFYVCLKSDYDITSGISTAFGINDIVEEHFSASRGKVNEMAIERPSAKKARIDAENKKLDGERKKLSYIMDNIFYGEEPDTGISSRVSNEEFADLCSLAGIEEEIPIRCYEIRLGRMEDRRSPFHSESWLSTNLGQHLIGSVGHEDDYLDKYCPSLYLHFDKEVEEKMTDELADYLNGVEEELSNHPLIDHVDVSERCIKFIMKPLRPNYDAYIKAIDNGFRC